MWKKAAALTLALALMLVLGITAQASHRVIPPDAASGNCRILRSDAPSGPAEASALVSPKGDFGSDKGDAVAALVREVYGHDLSDFVYVPVCGLDTDQVAGGALTDISHVYADLAVALKNGDHAPFGFLYQGDAAYALVEQTDGSLNLTRYQLTPSADGAGYCVVEVENAVAARNVVDTLYQ